MLVGEMVDRFGAQLDKVGHDGESGGRIENVAGLSSAAVWYERNVLVSGCAFVLTETDGEGGLTETRWRGAAASSRLQTIISGDSWEPAGVLRGRADDARLSLG
jgi:hypothetical protein